MIKMIKNIVYFVVYDMKKKTVLVLHHLASSTRSLVTLSILYTLVHGRFSRLSFARPVARRARA